MSFQSPILVPIRRAKASDMVANLTAEFSHEKNIIQREIVEAALIEFLQKYGYKQEVEALLKNQQNNTSKEWFCVILLS